MPARSKAQRQAARSRSTLPVIVLSKGFISPFVLAHCANCQLLLSARSAAALIAAIEDHVRVAHPEP